MINQWATGVLTIEAQTANQNRSGWTYEASASGEWIEEYEARFDDISGAAWGLNVKAEGMTLVVEEDLPNSAGSPPYCGSGGSIAGTYFQAERLPDPSR